MTAWTSNELNKIGSVEELQLASLRRDGTLRKPVTIWVVRIEDDLYVRAYKGSTSPWFRSACTRHEGQIRAGGVVKDVTFVEEHDLTINEKIDNAYRTTYRPYTGSIVDSMVTPDARAATLNLMPRLTGTTA